MLVRHPFGNRTDCDTLSGMKPKRNCAACGGEIPSKRRATQRFCSSVCYGKSNRGVARKGNVKHRVVLPPEGHPLAIDGGRVPAARIVLYDKIGPGAHPCNWCSNEIDWNAQRYAPNAIIADHLDWDPSNDAPDNLVASCNPCNAHRRAGGTSTRLTDDDKTIIWGGVRTRAVELFCQVCGARFLIPPSATFDGKGRTCSRSCARRLPRRSRP